MSSNFKYIVLYKPPIEELDDNNIETWRKVFYFSKYDCPSSLDFECKVKELVQKYNMNKKYVIKKVIPNGK